jgi:hypothetical protein
VVRTPSSNKKTAVKKKAAAKKPNRASEDVSESESSFSTSTGDDAPSGSDADPANASDMDEEDKDSDVGGGDFSYEEMAIPGQVLAVAGKVEAVIMPWIFVVTSVVKSRRELKCAYLVEVFKGEGTWKRGVGKVFAVRLDYLLSPPLLMVLLPFLSLISLLSLLLSDLDMRSCVSHCLVRAQSVKRIRQANWSDIQHILLFPARACSRFSCALC